MQGKLKRFLAPLIALILLAVTATGVFAAPELRDADAQKMFELLNRERKTAGLEPLVWNDDLAEAAQIRALELTEEYNSNHIRPDGTSFITTSTMVWGENTAFGYKTPDTCMTAFMKSDSHRENILRDSFTMVGIACSVGEDGTYYWVHSFGDGTSNWSTVKAKAYTLDPFGDPKVPLKKLSVDIPIELVGRDGSVIGKNLTTQLERTISAEGKLSASVRISNAGSISSGTLAEFAKIAGAAGKSATIQADTLTEKGAVQGRITLEPARLTGRTTGIKLGVYTKGTAVTAMRNKLQSLHPDTGLVVIRMEHKGTLTVPTRISAKVDLSKLNTDALRFYLYDSTIGGLTPIAEPNYRIDDVGYLHFDLLTAGDIVISDTDLQ